MRRSLQRQRPVYCDHHCVALLDDPAHCGECGHVCEARGGFRGVCVAGTCAEVCADLAHADCTSEPGCETALGTPTDCGGCGDPTVQRSPYAALDLRCRWGCSAPLCAAGYANCDTTSPDCETPFGSASSACFPKYLGTSFVAVSPSASAVAAAADGSYFYGGDFTGSVDLDPTSGVETKQSGQGDAFITKLNPNGTYAWTRTFGASGEVRPSTHWP